LTSIDSSRPLHTGVPQDPSVHPPSNLHRQSLHVLFDNMEEEEEPLESRPPRDQSVDYVKRFGDILALQATQEEEQNDDVPMGDQEEESKWEMEYDMDDQQELELLENAQKMSENAEAEEQDDENTMSDGEQDMECPTEYDVDDLQEQERLENAAGEEEEEGESELDNFSHSSEDESDYQESEVSEDGMIVIPDCDQERDEASSMETDYEEPAMGDA